VLNCCEAQHNSGKFVHLSMNHIAPPITAVHTSLLLLLQPFHSHYGSAATLLASLQALVAALLDGHAKALGQGAG
jgi:hypothetical protein